jgi:hypothetical protein
MKRFSEDRGQGTLLPELLDDYVAENNPVRVVDVFVDELDLAKLGFERVQPAKTGRPAYLDDPEVSIDTNHLERALRVIPIGRKNWLLSWTELGAKHVGIVQSLLATCRLHDINPSNYFVDVLQRVGQHSASLLHQLTPRIWKEMFADNPQRSDLHDLGGRPAYTTA